MNSKQKRGWRRHVIAQLASVTTKDLAEAYAEAMKKAERTQDYIAELEERIAELEQVSAAGVKVIEWIEEAVEYVGDPAHSPSMEREGRDLLAQLKHRDAMAKGVQS